MATDVVIPMMGITVETGTIVEWLKKEGDHLTKGECLFVVEMDKVTAEVESPATGILARILIPEGLKVPVLTLVAVITEPGEVLPEKYSARIEGEPAETAVVPVQALQPETISVEESPDTSQAPIRAVPAARRFAREKKLDLSKIQGTGSEGIILYKDVEQALADFEKPAAKVSTLARRMAAKEGIPLAGIRGSGARGRIMRADVQSTIDEAKRPALGKVISMERMRQVIARRMSESAFTAPHIYFFTDIQMDPLLNFRRQIVAEFEEKFGVRPSINDFLIKAVALNILDFPMLNASVKDKEIHIAPQVNVCLAVALADGLIVPAIANADIAGLADIVRQRQDLVARARTGNLTIEELERGTFTISSLAQYDITHFTAILNPPQSGILSVAKTREELYLGTDGVVKQRKVIKFGLSVDHRIIDGTAAADFLQNLKWKLERPAFTFLHF
jgi:pyruvate dehydrogenase E2 component (dihydrolipoamide acetyltransferase)